MDACTINKLKLAETNVVYGVKQQIELSVKYTHQLKCNFWGRWK